MVTETFSPLSIGSLSVTSDKGMGGRNRVSFQSPFYRVFECNLKDNKKCLMVNGDFHSLSIGSLSVTSFFMRCNKGCLGRLSVPFLSGL